MKTLKIVGLVTGFLGIFLAFLDLSGCSAYSARMSLRDQIRTSSQGIPRTADGFEDFLDAFPPRTGVARTEVTHIIKDVLQTHDGFPVSITIRYLAQGQRSHPVANFSQVEQWASEKRFGWFSWFVAAVGWAAVAFVELQDVRKKRGG